MIKELLLPNLGEGVDSADVSDVLVKPGDIIGKDDPILVLESEKATMEIPTEFSGKVKEIFVNSGDQISPGSKLISIEVTENAKNAQTRVKKTLEAPKAETKKDNKIYEPTKEKNLKIVEKKEEEKDSPKVPFASPAVRRFARELGADLSLVWGTGPKGRIIKEDVQTYIKNQLTRDSAINRPRQPEIDFSQWGDIARIPLNKIRKITGERMTTAWQTVPQVTNFDKVDITELDELRRSLQKINNLANGKITLLPFIMKACVKTLAKFPDVNSSLSPDGQELIIKKYYHIRVAVDTPEGLMVPVLRNVDEKTIFELSNELAEISEKARKKRILPDDLAGGTFTISSLGGIGGTYFTPIVNPPEVAILGVSRSKMELVFDETDFEGRLMLPLTLSYDHRVVDGALAARLMKFLNEQLSDVKNLSDANLL